MRGPLRTEPGSHFGGAGCQQRAPIGVEVDRLLPGRARPAIVHVVPDRRPVAGRIQQPMVVQEPTNSRTSRTSTPASRPRGSVGSRAAWCPARRTTRRSRAQTRLGSHAGDSLVLDRGRRHRQRQPRRGVGRQFDRQEESPLRLRHHDLDAAPPPPASASELRPQPPDLMSVRSSRTPSSPAGSFPAVLPNVSSTLRSVFRGHSRTYSASARPSVGAGPLAGAASIRLVPCPFRRVLHPAVRDP